MQYVAKLLDDMKTAIAECVADMNGMQAARVICFNPLLRKTRHVKAPFVIERCVEMYDCRGRKKL
jgi:hypothetical protein